jgi:hypothetical protein
MKMFVVIILFTLSIRAQSVNSSGTVAGYVTCSDGSVPGRGAKILLIPITELIPSAASHAQALKTIESSADFDGRFIIPLVPEGTYIIEARKDGYSDDLELVRLVLAKLKPEQQKDILANFPQTTIHAGVESENNLVLNRAGSLSGRALVDDGGTLSPTTVSAVLLSSPVLGDLTATPYFVRQGITDDHGNFRVAGLPAGKYQVSIHLTEAYLDVSVSSKNEVSMHARRVGTADLQVFAPESLTETDAKQISVRDGDDLRDIDITVPMRKLHSISGKILEAGQKPASGVSISLQPQGKKAMSFEAISDAAGAYRFDLLPSGTYSVKAKGPSQPDPKDRSTLGETTVQLNNDSIVDANVSIHP